MKTRLLRRSLGAFVASLLFCTALPAQWVTEEFQLKAGWNAVYLNIDASHATLNELVGGDPGNPIEEIWMWVPPGPGLQVFEDLQPPQSGSTEWLRWDRYWAAASPMQRLAGNVACLVRVADGAPDYTWTLSGKPMPPVQNWSGSGMNLLGFPTPRSNPPMWGDFLGSARSLHDHAEIYRYVGGPLGSGNPQRLFSSVLRTTPLVRNQAYWVRAEEYNRYFGPFEVDLENPEGIHFGANLGRQRLRLRNRIDEPVTVTAELVASAAAPANERVIAGQVPLILRGEQNLSDLTYGFTRFSEENGEWSLPPAGEPGSDVEVVVGIDRAAMGGSPGDLFAGILRLRDTSGLILIDLPVTAEVATTTGLWVGNAVVGEVAHYLVDYVRDESDEPVQNPDGSYAVEGVDESFGPVARPFPLRLLVHNDGAGNARLLQRVYHGLGGEGEDILSRTEDALDPAALDEARRISVAHLPWSEGNETWPFNGGLGDGAQISVSVALDYDDHATSPFLHTYHPDHDNLDARFENALPRGAESYDVVREITMRVQPPGGDFSGVTAGSGLLSGIYEENLILRGGSTGSGAHTRTFRTRGGFALVKISDIGELRD